MNKEEQTKSWDVFICQLLEWYKNEFFAGFPPSFNYTELIAEKAWQARQPEIDQLKELVYEVDQGEGGARITYKEALMGVESSARAWKAAYKTHKAEVERLKAEIIDLKNALYECEQGEK